MQDDVRSAKRMLRTQPGFAGAVLVMLALGIGATTAIFTVINAVLISPLPYPDSDALVSIVHTVDGRDEPFFSDAIYDTYRENARAFEDVGVWTPYANVATITGRSGPEEIHAVTLSRGVLTTLGVQPQVGRIFSEADDAPRAPDTVMLGHGYWQREFGGDASIVGEIVTINARPHRVVGVMPPGFTFAGESDIVLPIRIDPARPVPLFRLRGIARLRAGVTMEQANADVARILGLWRANYPMSPTDPFRNTRYGPSLRPLKQDVVGDVGRTLWVVMWGSPQAAIGKRMREGNTGPLHEVVGVTADLHDEGLHLPPTATAFLPARLHDQAFGVRDFLPRRVSFVVRSDRRNTEALLGEVRTAVWAVNANLPLAQARSLGELYDLSMTRTSFALVMLGMAAMMALLLGVFGIYGVISYAVSQRRREIGIRIALGAQSRAILTLFVRRGLIMTSAGVAVGLAGAAAFAQMLRTLLFGISPFDPVAFVAVTAVLATAALIASYLPARRALSVSPVETISVE